MKVLVDMNLSPGWVALLGQAGIDSIHWVEVGPKDASDVQVMAFARANGYVVLTHDLDFGAILAASRERKPSVIQVRSDDVRPQVIGTKVVAALAQLASNLDEGALVTIDTARTRVRILPLVGKA